MRSWKLYQIFICLLLAQAGWAQTCPDLVYPRDGATDVPVGASLSWTDPGDVIGIVLTLGTQPGLDDILSSRTSSATDNYSPETGLPEDTQVYVSFYLTLSDGTSITCGGFTFRTAPFDRPPDCTRLADPLNGEENVPLGAEFRWQYAPRATGYYVTAISARGDTLAFNQDVGNVLAYNPPGSLPASTDIFVSVTPYNRLGNAAGTCITEEFATGASNVDCALHLPALQTFPDRVGLCPDRPYADLSVPTGADGYNWYRVGPDGEESLVGSGTDVRLDRPGPYVLEAFNRVGSINEYTVCNIRFGFEVVEAGIPVIRDAQVRREPDGLRIEVFMSGGGDYEFALDPDGPFQPSPVFSGLPLEDYTVYVRDRFGCGLAEREVTRRLSSADFPPFFTPNNDGANDLWKFEPPPDLSDAAVESIRIFDRYGNLLAELDENSSGWDGNLNGRPLPSSVYWFEAISIQRNVIRGYFALKR